MDLSVTEKTYSGDNYDPSLCVAADGASYWTAWAAYEKDGSRAFVRKFDGGAGGPIRALSDRDNLQTRPLCVPTPEGTTFVWFEKVARTYSVWSRRDDGDGDLTAGVRLYELPAGTKPGELHAECDDGGALWLSWAQAGKGGSTIELLRADGDGPGRTFSLTAETPYNYRPRLAGKAVNLRTEGGMLSRPGGTGEHAVTGESMSPDKQPPTADGVYLIWDAYAGGTYDVYGCSATSAGPSEIVRISGDAAWENKSTICRDGEDVLWVVWVCCRDAMYRDSVIHQKFSLRGARRDGGSWEAMTGPDGGPEIAPLNYGLLTDFSVHPQLGHMGRRLHPMLKAADDAVWLFHEAKADQADNTLISTGRLIGQRCVGGQWSERYDLARGRVYYELPHNHSVGGRTLVLARDVEHDELHLEGVSLSGELTPLPAECRDVDLTEWADVRLPLPQARRPDPRPENALGEEDRGRHRLFWADLHAHSVLSVECEGEPDELSAYARDKAEIDVLTISDNDHFWTRFERVNRRYLKDSEWDCMLGNAMVMNDPGRFALFPGYEMSIGGTHRKERNHLSTMADDDEMEQDSLHFDEAVREALEQGRRRTNKDISACLAWAKSKGYLPLPHAHVNWWTLLDADLQCAVDVCAAWERNIERFDVYFDYLSAGHRFGFTGSGDSHYRNPGFGGAITGVWAERLDRASILDAIRARRTYATAGERILIEFAINGHVMGSSIVVSEDPLLEWRVVGQDGPYILRIHRDGRLMHEERFTGSTQGELRELKFIQYRQGRHYYYIEVLSPDPIPDYPSNVAHALGGRAWSSPIWVETVDAASS